MNNHYFNGFQSKASLEEADRTFSKLAMYFPAYEPCGDGLCRLDKERSSKIRKGDSVLCGQDGVECVAFIVFYGKRAVCLLEAMIPDYEYDDPMQWSPMILSQNGYEECVDYNKLFADFKETAYQYIMDEWATYLSWKNEGE